MQPADSGTPTKVEQLATAPEPSSETVRVIDLVCQLEERNSRGESITPEELCRGSPDLLPRVREQWKKLQVANQALGATAAGSVTTSDGELPNIPGYDYVRPLGEGGMGTVFLAQSRALKRLVAVKTIRGSGFERVQLRQRFRVEAEAVARLQHPNVVQIFESGEHNGLPYIVMEFCPNGSLAGRIKNQTLPPREAARLMVRLAGAMAAAHAANIVHRDLKPENVLLAADDSPKITDFGIARILDEEQHLTQANAIMGTAAYMSPEQSRGELERVSNLSDVWTLGVILYRLVTGVVPFQGKSLHETLRMVQEDLPAAPRRIVGSIPRDLEVICLKCLRKEPSGRYASAQALADDLERFLAGLPIDARPVGGVERAWKWVRRNPVVTLLLAGLVAATIGGGIGIYTNYLDARRQEAEAKKQSGLAEDRARDIFAKAIALDEALTGQRQTNAQLQDELKRTRRLLDNGRMRQAADAFSKHMIELAHEHLDAVDPENRGFEWGYLKRKLEGSIFTLHGHEGSVTGVAVSGDDRLIITGSNDHSARLWDGRTGAPLRELRGHADYVYAVAISRDGLHAFTASEDGTARVWNTISGECVRELPHGRKVICLAISPDGGKLATGCEDSTARLWNWRTGEVLQQLTGHKGNVTRVAFSPDGRSLATGSGALVRIWQTATGKLLKTIDMKAQAISGLAFAPDGRRVFVGGLNRKLSMLDALSGEPINEFPDLQGDPAQLAVSPDGRLLAAAIVDHWERAPVVQVFDVATQKPVREYLEHSGGVLCVAFSADGQRVLSGGRDKSVRIWGARGDDVAIKVNAGLSEALIALHPDGRRIAFAGFGAARTQGILSAETAELFVRQPEVVSSVGYDADGRWLAIGMKNGDVRLWNAESRVLVAELFAAGEIKGVQISDDGSRVAACSSIGSVYTWDVASRRITQFNFQFSHPYQFALSPDGKRLATIGNDGNTRIWNAATGERMLDLPVRRESDMCFVFSADGNWLVTGGAGNTVRIFDSHTGKLLREMTGHGGQIRSIAVSRDRKRIVSGSVDKTIRVWDAQSGLALLELPAEGIVDWVGLSADGQRLVSRAGPDTLRIWEGRPSVAIQRLREHSSRVQRAAVSADGRWLVSGGFDQTVCLWDARTGALIRVLNGADGSTDYVDISRDGQRVASASSNGSLRAWDAADGRMLFQHRVNANGLMGVRCSPDGQRIYTRWLDERMVFDAASGNRLRDAEWVDGPQPSGRYPDGSRIAVCFDRTVRIVPTSGPDEAERTFRSFQTRFDAEAHRNALRRFPVDPVCDLFHLDALQAHDPRMRTDRDFLDRAQLLEEWLRDRPNDALALTDLARINHRAARWRLTPAQRKHFETLALERGTALDLRILGGLLLRENKAGEAIEPLQMAIARRVSTVAPPVEEALLALAFHQLKRPVDARRWLERAEIWLAKCQTPCAIAALIGQLALGEPHRAIIPPVEPLDPRYRRCDWQAWDELRVILTDPQRLIQN